MPSTPALVITWGLKMQKIWEKLKKNLNSKKMKKLIIMIKIKIQIKIKTRKIIKIPMKIKKKTITMKNRMNMINQMIILMKMARK